MVSDFDATDSLAYFFNNCSAFVSKDGGKNAFRIVSGKRECVCVTDSGGNVSDQHFSGFRSFEINHIYLQRLSSFPGNCSS